MKEKPVSLGGRVRENLPFPFVYYPNHYGTFFGFSKDETSPIVLCSCSKQAIKNLLRLKLLIQETENSNPLRMAPLDSWYFPSPIANQSLSAPENPFSVLTFAGGLCHRCNGIIPQRRYCLEMYGSKFIQQYGWYVNQAYLRLGVLPPIGDESITYLSDVCPPEIQNAILASREADKEYQDSDNPEDWDRLRRTALKKYRAFTKMVENIVRQEFGFKNVGESWVAETQLFYEIRETLAPLEVQHHASPDWLGQQHLDIFVPELKVAVEYQGRQHFEPVKFFGGKEAYEKTKVRDRKKQQLCKEHGVKLILVQQGYALDDVVQKIQQAASD